MLPCRCGSVCTARGGGAVLGSKAPRPRVATEMRALKRGPTRCDGGGKFILRIEDTDQERSTEASVATILDGLEWLGIGWDEGPFFQSRNVETHRALARRFLEEKSAYPCFCTTAELEARRAEAERGGGAWK